MKQHQKNLLHILGIFLVTYGVYAAIISKYKEKFGDNISSFICMGTEFMKPEEMPQGMFYLKDSMGYDGQFFYFIARDPFITGNMHQRLDVPAYRYQRIMYPLLARISALGNVEKLPKTLVSVNLAAILIGTLLVAGMLLKQQMSPWYALFYAALNGFVLALLRDLSGPVAMAFTVGAFYCYSNKRYRTSAILLAAGILSREIVAAIAPVMFLDSLFIKKEKRPAIFHALSLLPFTVWKTFISIKLDILPWESAGQGNFDKPLTTMISHYREIMTAPGKLPEEQIVLSLFILVSVISFGLAVREIIRSRNEISICFLGYSILPFIMSYRVWIEPWSYCRVLLPAGVMLVLAFVRSKDKLYLVPLSLHALLFFATYEWLFA